LAEVLELPEPTRAQLIEPSRRPLAADTMEAPSARRADGQQVPAQLPTDIADFTGRDSQVQGLCKLLSGSAGGHGSAAVRIACVAGTGGLGKTALAVHAAHLLAPQFPDGQLYANLLGATQPVDPAEVLGRFLRDFGVDATAIPTDTDGRAARYRSLIAGHRMLIVLDDARDAAQVRPLLPGTGSCAVLVTTRGRMPDLAGARTIDLDVLSHEEAHALFTQVAGNERVTAEPAATEAVLGACAGLPLAIRIAGARLAARSAWTVQHLADRLADEHKRLDMLRAGDLGVRAAFEVSYTSLPSSETPDEVDPARAFRLLGLWTGPSISLLAASALLGEEEDAVADVLDVLVDAHLLESPEPDRYQFHDLLRVYAAERASTQETGEGRIAAITRLLTWYLHTVDAAAGVISPHYARVPLGQKSTREDFRSLDQALAWCEGEGSGLVAATRLAAAVGLHEIAWKLAASSMSFYYRRSHRGDWVASHEIGLASARILGDRRAEAWILNRLGMAYGVQHRKESITCLQEALEINKELRDEPEIARAANNLANTYIEFAKFSEAKEAAELALGLHLRVGTRHGEGIALDLLGAACRELGQPGDAVGHLQQSLAIFREVGARDAEADSLGELGVTYLSLGQLDEAIAHLRAALAIQRDIGDRHYQSVTLQHLGRGYRMAGNLRLAREVLREALQLCAELGEPARAAQIRDDLASLGRSEEGTG
jgi:tetratricopeptide (TPR) repeat protein